MNWWKDLTHDVILATEAYRIHRTRTHHKNAPQSHSIDFNYDIFFANIFSTLVGRLGK